MVWIEHKIVDRFKFNGGRELVCDRIEYEETFPREPTKQGIDLDRLWRLAETRAWLTPHCESPIEITLGAHLFVFMQDNGFSPKLCLSCEAPTRPANEVLLIPQFRWERYRGDFVIRIPGTPRQLLFIECDGRDFHRATTQQIERDRGRDQEMIDVGHKVFRFTGSQINRYPASCALAVLGRQKRPENPA
jgi:very-short-patch-repair endonuclease